MTLKRKQTVSTTLELEEIELINSLPNDGGVSWSAVLRRLILRGVMAELAEAAGKTKATTLNVDPEGCQSD